MTDFQSALETLKTFLENALDGHADFLELGGADVGIESQTDVTTRDVRPYVSLSGRDEAADGWGFDARRATVRCECGASEFAGGLTGAENPKSSAQRLSEIVQNTVRDGYKTLRGLGFYGSKIRVTGEREESKDQARVKIIEHEIEFVFFTE